jgi:predicted dehydrogenase
MEHAAPIIRVGGVGTGRIFQKAHLRVYPTFLREARLVGFYDLDRSRAKEARDIDTLSRDRAYGVEYAGGGQYHGRQ